MGFQDSTGAATVDAATKKLTLSGDFSVGDVITVQDSATTPIKTASYTVTGNDLLSGKQATILEQIAKNLTSQFKTSLGQSGITSTGAVITFTAGPVAPTDGIVAPVNKNGMLTNIKDLAITTNNGANIAIAELDNAINTINGERSGIGAVINRLTYSVDNLANVSQNTSESRSRILDTDYAKASSELARTQIISQAATAMLAQANQSPQSVLQLLRGG